MRRNGPTYWVLLGASGGAVAGIIGTFFIWLLLPNEVSSIARTSSPQPDAARNSQPDDHAETDRASAKPANPADRALNRNQSAPVAVTAENRPRSDHQLANLRGISQAMQTYHDLHKRFPLTDDPNYKNYFDARGRPHLSWRVHVLPFVGNEALWRQFSLTEPWDSPHNHRLLERMPDIYRDDHDLPNATTTRFVTITGADTVFPGPHGLRLLDLKDGPSSTILVLRVGRDRAVPWTKPDDAVFDPAAPLDCLGTLDSDGLMVATADGAQPRLPAPIPAELFKALVTVNGHEPIDLNNLEKYRIASAKPAPAERKPAAKTPGASRKPPPAEIKLTLERATAAARRGDWTNAASDFARYFEIRPISELADADHFSVFQYGPVLAHEGDRAAYEAFCREVLKKFGDSTNPMLAERTAKICLLRPTADDIASRADKLADRAIELGAGHQYLSYFEFAKALAQYRLGNYKGALDWSTKSQDDNRINSDTIWYLVATTHVLQSMSHQQLGDFTKARQSLRVAQETFNQKLPNADESDLGSSWYDRLAYDVLRHEAQRCMQPAITLAVPVIPREKQREPAEFRVRVSGNFDPGGSYEALLSLHDASGTIRPFPMQRSGSDFSVKAVAFPEPPKPAMLRIRITGKDGKSFYMLLLDRKLTIGARNLHLGEVRRLHVGKPTEALLHDGESISGNLSGMDSIDGTVDEQPRTLRLSDAEAFAVIPKEDRSAVTCSVVLRLAGNEIARNTQVVYLEGTEPDSLESLGRGKFNKPRAAALPTTYFSVQGAKTQGTEEPVTWDSSHLKVKVNNGTLDASADGWTLRLAAARNETLRVGEFPNVNRFPSNDKSPALSFDIPGQGNNQVSGKFVIWELELDGDKIVRLAADFIQFCEGQKNPVAGLLRVNSAFE
jgi:tetratricopeptide (TPR) repeat protein